MTEIQVLVVDNEPLMRQALKIILEAAPGFQWLGEATNGIEAVDFCTGNNPDVILMDMQMPQMDGLEATRQIRLLEGPNRQIPIVALTASAMLSDQQACRDAGMDDVLTKPVDYKLLAACLARWSPPRPAVALP